MIAALLAAALVQAAPAAEPGPPAEVRPSRVIGAGLWVRDLEAEREWFISKLGMRVVMTYPQYHEYILAFPGGGPGSAILNLQASTQRPPGPNHDGRLILGVPNAKALAAWLNAHGAPTREALPDVAYFLTDPEENPIELYTPPAKP